MKVLILVDSDRPDRRRTCFWKNLEGAVAGATFEYRSLADARDNFDFIDYNEFQVIVFNWDVLNGDYWFRGDVTAGMIDRASRDFLPEWLNRGGLLLLEAQCRHWIPSQAAYEVALKRPGFRTWKYDYYKHTPGTHFGVNRRYSDHPFLSSLNSKVEHGFKGQRREIEDWFPSWLRHECTKYNYIPMRTHSGVFLTWEPVWLPLLLCGQTSQPIMLARIYGDGAIVATTMYLASSGQKDLVANLLQWKSDASSFSPEVLAYHRKRVWRNSLGRWSVRVAPIVLILSLAVYYYSELQTFFTLLGLAGAFVISNLNAWLREKIKDAFQRAKASLSTKGPGEPLHQPGAE